MSRRRDRYRYLLKADALSCNRFLERIGVAYSCRKGLETDDVEDVGTAVKLAKIHLILSSLEGQ